MPVIVFGGKNTKLNGGTFLKVQGGSLLAQTGGTGNRPFNDLWLALAPAFGVSLTSLGDQTQYTGSAPRYRLVMSFLRGSKEYWIRRRCLRPRAVA